MASQRREGGTMTGLSRFSKVVAGIGVAIVAMAVATGAHAQGKPNILFVMGDDIGWFNIGAYNQGIMAGRTPNLDQLAAEGMRFTDYYAEASCTAGRANFITGELLTSPAASRADSAAPRSGRLRSA